MRSFFTNILVRSTPPALEAAIDQVLTAEGWVRAEPAARQPLRRVLIERATAAPGRRPQPGEPSISPPPGTRRSKEIRPSDRNHT
jgi:hypothetical protein